MSVTHLDKHGLTTPKVTTEQLVLNGRVVDLSNMGGGSATSVEDPAFFKSLVRRCELPDDRYYTIWSDNGDLMYMNFADKIENGAGMFSVHENLRNFTFPLTSLRNGNEMFTRCKLNKKSVFAIIKTLKEENTLTGNSTIHLGIDKSLETDEELTALIANTTIPTKTGGSWKLYIYWN